jgi:hypothetical protein
MTSIRHLESGFDVSGLQASLAENPELWDAHKMRTDAYHSPHNSVSDIWVRYNAWDNFTGDIPAFNAEHVSEWYPCITKIPEVWSLSRKVFHRVGGKELGGVLITRIPPHGEVKPHIDHGWHADYYEKFAIQVKSNKEQAFCFEDNKLHPLPGDLYTFDNSKLHWVTNPTDEERITLIICIKRENVPCHGALQQELLEVP